MKLPDELMGGAVKVIHPTDLRNRVGRYMMEERGVKMGRNVDPGDVQDMIVEFVQREATPKPIGDVQEIARKLYNTLSYVKFSAEVWNQKAVAILAPWFTPASTPAPEKESK